MWIIAINGEEYITDQGELDELNCHQTPRGKSKINICLCRRKRYQITYLEDIQCVFDQVRLIASHLEVLFPKKPSTPKNIGEGSKDYQTQFWK